MNPTTPLVKDEYSYSVPDEVRVQHMDLDLEVLFNDRILRGAALLTLDAPFSGDLVLDTRDLIIDSVEFSQDKESFRSATFKLGGSDPIKGAPLSIFLPQRASAVRIRYHTAEKAYRQILVDQPTNFRALCGLAAIRNQLGAPGEARDLIGRAVDAAGRTAEDHVVLGTTFIPFSITFIPTFYVVVKLGLYNTRWPWVIWSFGN